MNDTTVENSIQDIKHHFKKLVPRCIPEMENMLEVVYNQKKKYSEEYKSG